MGGKCQCCGYKRCFDSLDLHHLDPNAKDFSFGGMRANPTAWSAVVAELRKCVLVCRNCHGEIHCGIRAVPADHARFNEAFADYRKLNVPTEPCPVCDKPKPTRNRYCSLTCSGRARHLIDWDSIPLMEWLVTKTKISIAEDLGVSLGAVARQARKLAAQVGDDPTSVEVHSPCLD